MMSPISLIIAGSRNFQDYDLLCSWMREVQSPIREIVSGCASGADSLGERWAIERSIPLKLFPANWEKYGKAAGPIRNKQMAEYADCALVFWSGNSAGSRSMIVEMARVNKRFHVVLF